MCTTLLTTDGAQCNDFLLLMPEAAAVQLLGVAVDAAVMVVLVVDKPIDRMKLFLCVNEKERPKQIGGGWC